MIVSFKIDGDGKSGARRDADQTVRAAESVSHLQPLLCTILSLVSRELRIHRAARAVRVRVYCYCDGCLNLQSLPGVRDI